MNLNWAAPYGSSSCVGSCTWSTLHFSMAQCCSALHIALGLESVLLHQENILSSWERISLDREVEERLPHTEGWGCQGCWAPGHPHRPRAALRITQELVPVKAICFTHIFSGIDQGFQNLPGTESTDQELSSGGGWAQHISLGLTPQQGLVQSHSEHLAARKRGYETCRRSSIFKLSMGLMCWCQEVPGGRHNSSN